MHVESTSRRHLPRGSIAPGIPRQQEAKEQNPELLRIALGSGGTRTGDVKESGRHHEPLGEATMRNYDEERGRTRGFTTTREIQHDDSRRGEKTNKGIHDELEERRRTRGITTRRQGEDDHESSGECEDRNKRGVTTGVARQRCHEGDYHQRTTRQRTA